MSTIVTGTTGDGLLEQGVNRSVITAVPQPELYRWKQLLLTQKGRASEYSFTLNYSSQYNGETELGEQYIVTAIFTPDFDKEVPFTMTLNFIPRLGVQKYKITPKGPIGEFNASSLPIIGGLGSGQQIFLIDYSELGVAYRLTFKLNLYGNVVLGKLGYVLQRSSGVEF